MNNAKFVHIFVETESGLFLQLRDDIPGIYDPNTLCAFGGHMDDDDVLPRTAALRELGEETGVIANEADLSLKGITRRRELDLAGDDIRKVVYGYSISMPGLEELTCYEGQRAMFIAFGSNILRLEFGLSNITHSELQRYYPGKYLFS